ncbi:MAG TPA: hypothetical protein VF550_21200 [Polyangia bacterium]
MRTNSFAVLALVLFTTFSVSCGGGGGTKPNEGGLAGFSSGTAQVGPVPSDGTSPDAPVVVDVVATNPVVNNGDQLHVKVSFTDPQGDISTVNVGIAGQSTHSAVSVTKAGTLTNGTLLIDLQPATNSPGTYVLVVSLTDLAGHTSAAITLTFTILNPDGTMPSSGFDSGAPSNPKDAALPIDAPAGRDSGSAESGYDPSKFRNAHDGLLWSDRSTTTMVVYDAEKYCAAMGGRLPTISELRTLIVGCVATQTGGACGLTDTCLTAADCRTSVCAGCGLVSDGSFSTFVDTGALWSSSLLGNVARWVVDFNYGGSVTYLQITDSAYVRCVGGVVARDGGAGATVDGGAGSLDTGTVVKPVDAGGDLAMSDTAVGDAATITDMAPRGDGACADSPGGVIQSTATGGLWFDATTWVCGVVPAATDDVQINAEVQVNLSAAKVMATCRNLTVAATGVLRGASYTAGTILVSGDLTNLGAVRNGPDFASYDTATLEVRIGGNFTQNKAYGGVTTRFVGTTTQTISYAASATMGGTFIDDNPASSLKAGSAITAAATTMTMGTADTGRATLDMGTFALNLSSGDFKVAYGVLRASRIVGTLGATLTADQIVASSATLSLEGDICTASTSITGSVVVAASTAFYNQGYTDATVTIAGNLTNNGIIRHGPGFAAYGEGSMTINLSGDFAQNGDYTATATNLNGTTAQTISLLAGKTLTGKFTDTTAASPILAGSDLTIADAEIVLGVDSVSTSTLRMGTYKINHPSGNLKIATGTLEANDITGDTTGAVIFNLANVVPPSGTLSISGYFPTATMKVTGNLALQAGARMYNQGYVQAYLTVTGNVTTAATSAMGSGPGYASYDSGALFLNGTKLAAW